MEIPANVQRRTPTSTDGRDSRPGVRSLSKNLSANGDPMPCAMKSGRPFASAYLMIMQHKLESIKQLEIKKTKLTIVDITVVVLTKFIREGLVAY